MLAALLSLINMLREADQATFSEPKVQSPPPSNDVIDLGLKTNDGSADETDSAAATVVDASPKTGVKSYSKKTSTKDTDQEETKSTKETEKGEDEKDANPSSETPSIPDLFLISSTGVTSSSNDEPVEDPDDETPPSDPDETDPPNSEEPQDPPEEPDTGEQPPAEEPDEGSGGTPPEAPEQEGPSSGGGSTDPTDASANNYDVAGGRVTTLSVENADDVASVRVINGPDHGNLTVNPDNTLALVMSMEPNYSGNLSISYEVTYNDGSTQIHNDNINVLASQQQAGWGQGTHYMLETDESGDLIVEAGADHRAVYISGSSDALSRAEIAQIEGLSTNDITTEWLVGNPQYGGTEGMAVDSDVGMDIWYAVTGRDVDPNSNWLLFERGYEYDDLGRVVSRGTEGESELHPVHITSYGEGDKPVLNTSMQFYQTFNQNIVVTDLTITDGVLILNSENILFDGVEVTNEIESPTTTTGMTVQGVDGFTLRDSVVRDVFGVDPFRGNDTWEGNGNAITNGVYISESSNPLFEGNLFTQNGFAPDYEYDLSGDGGQAPTKYNHNLYIQRNNDGVTLRDNILMDGSSFGVQVRPGGFVEDNVMLNNNIGANLIGGDRDGDTREGNFTLFTDNVITSAAHRDTSDGNIGALARGVDSSGYDTTLLDNIIAHLADPNNAAEQASKTHQHGALNNNGADFYYDDTIIHNWLAANGRGTTGVNTDGLNTDTLDATTIQIFTQELLGDPNATIGDLANYLKAQAAGDLDHYVDADLIIDFFQTGFGLSVDDRLSPEVLRFVPSDLGDGIRWDNRLNWDTEDLPGTIDGDSVDLAGNWVNYGGSTVLEDLDFGEGGTLNVSHGYLRVADHTAVGESGAELNVSGSGQIWMDGYTDGDLLEIDVDGGRFANTGLFTGGTDVDVTDGQVLLGAGTADFVLGDGARIDIVGDDAEVGFDGSDGGPSVLLMSAGSTLSFTAEAQENGDAANDLTTIEEFQSGAFGDAPNIQSGANLGGSTLELNLAGWTGDATSTQLLSVDQLVGQFDTINVTGLGGGRDAEVVIDYATDTVTLNISASGQGSGQSTITTTGNEDDAQSASALWDALTNGHGIYSNDPASGIPDDEEDDDDLMDAA